MRTQEKVLFCMKFFALLSVITVFAASPACAQTASPTALIVDYDQTIVPPDIEPGDVKTIYIVVKNTGGMPAREVRATLPTVGGLKLEGASSESVTSGGNWFLGTINPGASARLVASVRVSDDARVGTHYMTLYLTYDESRYTSSGSIAVEEEKSNWIIPVEVSGGSLLELEDYQINAEELKAGENVELKLVLKNFGESNAIDVKVSLGEASSAPDTLLVGSISSGIPSGQANYYSTAFTVLGASEKRLGDIKKKESGVAEFTVHLDEDVPSQAYTLPFSASYEDASGTEQVDTFHIGVYVSGDRKLAITNFLSEPAEIHSDDEDVEFSGKIENQGTEQVKNVKVTFSPSSPLKNARSFVQTKEVGTIKGGGSTEFVFYANVEEDVLPQQTNVTFLLEYEVNGQPFRDRIAFAVDVLENPRFEVSVDAPPTRPSEKGTAKLTVENVGSKCDDVTVIVLEKREQPFDFEDKSAYIGDLDRNTNGVASIIYSVQDKAASQPHIVPLEIRCTKNDNVLVYSKTMKLEVGAAKSSSGSWKTWAILLVGAVAIASCFKKREKVIEPVKPETKKKK